MANQIGYDTNSKEVFKQKARVFVAGLGVTTTRDEIIDLFASYGRIVGASLFKGFAFVQYTNETEAELAVMALHGYTYKRAMLEVKCVYDPTKKDNSTPNFNPQKRKRDDQQAPSKKNKPNDENFANVVERAPEKPAMNKSAPAVATVNGDVFICGGCGHLTNYLEEFINHRKEGCKTKQVKSPDEPECYRCFTCSNSFPTSWELLYHLRVAHEITMYKIARN